MSPSDALPERLSARVGGGANLDPPTVEGFGREWRTFDQSSLPPAERARRFAEYFEIFPWETLPGDAVGLDVGCGSGRWALHVAPRVGRLHCLDASEAALGVARKTLAGAPNCAFLHASVDAIPLPDASLDFAYSLGVLHHVPDTFGAVSACVQKLKPGAPFLVYLYYALEDRPAWFRALWRLSDVVRRVVSALPWTLQRVACDAIAAVVYWPAARAARLGAAFGRDVSGWPLAFYRDASFYSMRTDSLDRFATRLERRFTKDEIRTLLGRAGLVGVRFREAPPYWCAVGFAAGAPSQGAARSSR